MKNLKQKIGVSLAVLTCFITLNCASVNAENKSEEMIKKDANVMKVIETLNQLNKNIPKRCYRYTPSQAKEKYRTYVEFYYRVYDNALELQLYEYRDHPWNMPENLEKVTIIDYKLDNLDSDDKIIYDTSKSSRAHFPFKGIISFKFSELSKKAQEEVKKEYNLMIKEAPNKLLERQKSLKYTYEFSI